MLLLGQDSGDIHWHFLTFTVPYELAVRDVIKDPKNKYHFVNFLYRFVEFQLLEWNRDKA